jgi:hypothetical protein
MTRAREFGHSYANIGGVIIDSWGVGPFFITDEAGKEWFFEDSDRFGPYIVNRKTHQLLANQPGERSVFWRAHRIWCRQGRRLEDDRCVWHEPKPTRFRRLSRRDSIVVEHGEEDGKCIEISEGATP